MTKHSFLPSSNDVLRTMVQGILESYENPWDLLAELAQNSMDAIRVRNPDKGKMSLLIDQKKRSIVWRDNGLGIDPSAVEDLFVIYGTNKRGNAKMIGEKGVGIKFVIFSSSSFELISHHDRGSFKLTVKSANNWLRGTEEEDISFQTNEIDNKDNLRGVTISLNPSNHDDPVFDLSLDQLINLLRTKTAVGSTKAIWSDYPENCDLDVNLKHVTGKTSSRNVDCSFLLPTAFVKKTISLDQFGDWSDGGTKSDDQKRKKLKDALIFNKGSLFQTSREIKYWSCMAPTRRHWGQVAVQNGLINPEDGDESNSEDHFFVQFGEVFLSTKFMPTGVTIELRPPGEAGYAENFFIIIEDETLSFDIGRKGIPPRTAGVLRKLAQSEFRKYLKLKRFIRGETSGGNSQFEREKLFDDVRSLPDLECDVSRFVKRPNGQEATIAALFFEQIGKGRFVGFSPYISGYRDRYDLTGRYENRNVVLEFKFDLSGLLVDFSSARKMFDEVNVLVVWELTEGDRKKAKERGIDVEAIESGDEYLFPESDTRLSIDSVAPIEVVQLKKLLKCQ